MCVPLVPALLIASAVVGAGGAIYGGIQANKQAKYEAAVDDRNAKLAAESGRDAQARGETERMRLWRQTAQRIGAQRAQYAASGLDVNFGTPSDVVADTSMIGGEDVLTSSENTRKEVRGFDIQGANYTAAGQAARMKGHAALIGGYISGAGKLLSAASQVAGATASPGGAGGGTGANFAAQFGTGGSAYSGVGA